MRPLAEQEKRTLRFGAVAIAAYLVLFGGFRVWKHFDRTRTDYLKLVTEARTFRQQLEPYRDKAEAAEKLMAAFRMDPSTLSRDTVVAKASAAIQQAAQGGGIQLGPIRELPARAAAGELAQMQMEWTGPAPAVLALLARLDSLGYPLVVDTLQFTAQNPQPGQVKVTLTLVILDFETARKKEAGRA